MQPPYPPPYPPSPGSPSYPAAPVAGVGREQQGWLRRHTGCAIGLGCITAAALVAMFFVAIFGVVMAAMKNSDVYAVATHTAQTDKVLIAELGAPIEAGWFVSGSVQVSGGTGDANISIPVSGPIRSGKVNAVAKKSGGRWTFSVLNAEVEGRPTAIDLLSRLPP